MFQRRCLANLVCACLVILLLCCGCETSALPQKQLSAADLVFSLEVQTVIQIGGQEYEGTFRYAPSQVASLELKSPADLQGLSYFWQGDHFQMTYQGLSVDAKECPLPDTAFATLLVQFLNEAQQTASLTSSGNNTFQGIRKGVPFTIIAQPDGTIERIEIPELEFVASFTSLYLNTA